MQEPEDGIRWQSPLIKVVFPHPFGPRSAVSVFDLSVNETLETIGFLYPAENPVTSSFMFSPPEKESKAEMARRLQRSEY